MELELPGWRRTVVPLPEGDERDPQVLEVFQHRHEMPQIPA